MHLTLHHAELFLESMILRLQSKKIPSNNHTQHLLLHGRSPPLAQLGLLSLNLTNTLVEKVGVLGL